MPSHADAVACLATRCELRRGMGPPGACGLYVTGVYSGTRFEDRNSFFRAVRVRKKDFENLVTSIQQAGRIKRGETKPSRVFEFAPVDVKAIRLRLGKSQSEFARMIGVSVGTLQNWEQGRRRPEGPARALLKVAAANPEAVAAALAT
jgi:putative transcriptional regulator